MILLRDVLELFPKCCYCGRFCEDELDTVLASERPYRVAHTKCQKERDSR